MDEQTLRLAVLLALIVGFVVGLVLGGVAGRAAEVAYRWHIVRKAVAHHTPAQEPTPAPQQPTVAARRITTSPQHHTTTVTPVAR